MANDPHPTLPRPKRPEPPRGTPEHAEWLLDEAGDETFPASDASAPVQPGSSEAIDGMANAGRKTLLTEQELKGKK